MELLNTETCTTCKGIENCNKNCIMHLGKSLYDFISNIDVIKTQIGDYSRRDFRYGTKDDLVCSGHIMYALNENGAVFSDISSIIDASDKFSNALGRSAYQILNYYCRNNNMTSAETKEIIDRLTAINKNRLLAIPFKAHTQCSVNACIENVEHKNLECEIDRIEWRTNQETYKLECIIDFRITDASVRYSKLYKCSITEYLDRFKLVQMNISTKNAKEMLDIIKITDHGFVKPIVISDGTASIAIDGTYVYYNHMGDIHVIGGWNDRNEITTSLDKNSKLYKALMTNMDAISKHRRYIAPYMLYSENRVLV